MKIVKNQDLDNQKWIDLLKLSVQPSPFQSPEYFKVFSSLKGHLADVFACENSQGMYEALVIVTKQFNPGFQSTFSKRAIIYDSPIYLEHSEFALSALIKYILNYYRKKLIYIEYRSFAHLKDSDSVFETTGWEKYDHLNMIISTDVFSSADDSLKAMTYNRKKEIRDTLKEQVTYFATENIDDVRAIYKILNDIYRTRIKLPLPSPEYFNAFTRCESAKVFAVSHNDRIIGGCFCLFNSETIYTLYYTGLRNYHPRIHATHIAIYAALDFAISNGLRTLDLMGGGKSDIPYGVRDYKQQFGARLFQNYRFRFVFKPLLFKLGKKVIQLKTGKSQ
jgi:serine/alanine adding enzyme